METIYRDFAPLGVQFIYLYKALAHPEMDGYVQPFTLQERLMHVTEAQRTIGSKIQWICDSMDNSITEALGNAPNSEWIIDPEGIVLVQRRWSDPEALREDLARIIGPIEHPTTVYDLDMKRADPPKAAPSGIVPRIERPAGARPIITVPKLAKDGDPFYIKLRAEATQDLLRDGSGKLYLGFHPDPLYHVHWNNLVAPIHVEVKAPDGIVVSETTLRGPKVEAEADVDPREFIVDVSSATADAVIQITAHYFACTEKWCRPLTQEYTLHLMIDPHGGNVRSAGGRGGGMRGGRPGGGPGGRPGAGGDPERMRRRFEQMDANGDGKLSRDELPERMQRMFERMDANGDGFVDVDEMTAMRRRRGGRGGGGGGGGPNN